MCGAFVAVGVVTDSGGLVGVAVANEDVKAVVCVVADQVGSIRVEGDIAAIMGNHRKKGNGISGAVTWSGTDQAGCLCLDVADKDIFSIISVGIPGQCRGL